MKNNKNTNAWKLFAYTWNLSQDKQNVYYSTHCVCKCKQVVQTSQVKINMEYNSKQ